MYQSVYHVRTSQLNLPGDHNTPASAIKKAFLNFQEVKGLILHKFTNLLYFLFKFSFHVKHCLVSRTRSYEESFTNYTSNDLLEYFF